MKSQWLAWAFVTMAWMVVPGFGQTKSDEAESLRHQIQALQEKLSAVEKSGMERRRITQLGASRVKEKEEEPRLVVRVYDLSDLFSLAPPYPALRISDLAGRGAAAGFFPDASAQPGAAGPSGAMGMGGMGAMGGMGGGFYSVKSGSDKANPPHVDPTPPSQPQPGGMVAARTSLDGLIEAITSTIAPTEWDEVGGPSSIAPLGNSLIISTTEPNHEQISTLLDTLRERWKTLRTISIEAHWLWLTEVQLASLLGANAKPAAKPAKSPSQAMLPDGPLASAAAIDRPLLMCHQLETTLRVPADRRMLVGGMTYEMRPNAGEPNLYLFMKAVVQELRDDQPPAKAEGKPAQMPGMMPGVPPSGSPKPPELQPKR